MSYEKNCNISISLLTTQISLLSYKAAKATKKNATDSLCDLGVIVQDFRQQ